VEFAAPSPPGRWTVSADGYGEVKVCINGQVVYEYGGASANRSTLTVVTAPLYIPIAVAAASRRDLTPPSSTAPTGSATAPPSTQPTRAVPTAPTRPPLHPTPTPVVAGSLPVNCLEIASANAAALDGEYIIAPGGRVFRVYCHDMQGTPREYLPLASVGAGSNYAMYRAGGYSNGTDVVSRYFRVRLDPTSLVVDTSDQVHASSTGMLTHGADRVTSMPYGVAMSCGAEFGAANIDLTGTPFRIAETFIVDGYGADGSVHYSVDDQVVDLSGRGYCGWINPSPSRVNPYNGNGGPDLDLAFVGYPNLVIDGCDTGSPDLVLPGGTSFGHLVRGCAESAADNAEFADCVAQLADQWRSLSLITDAQSDLLRRCAETALLPLDTPAPSATPATTASQTPSATPSGRVTPDTGPHHLDLTLDPNPARQGEVVTAHVEARDLGMDAVGLVLTRRDCTADCTRKYGGSIRRTMSTSLTFLAPAIGTWDVSASAFGEAFECRDGQCGWELYVPGSTRHPETLTVAGATRYLPHLIRPRDPFNTVAPTSTASATPTTTATPTPSGTPTEEPSLFRVSGYVREGSSSGPGLPGVAVTFYIQSSPSGLVTDSDGHYESRILELHGESWSVVPSKEGYYFDPPFGGGRHWGQPGRNFEVVDFVALRGTPSLTPPTPPTPTVAPLNLTDLVQTIPTDRGTGTKRASRKRGGNVFD
jgi:hypothetical protein